jgi:AraC-like DNA-binding protein
MSAEMASLPHTFDTVTRRALIFLESHLFENLPLDVIAKRTHSSTSSLNRAFKRDLGTTLKAYVRMRRLDEAMHLLKSGNHSVSEISMLVGYENLGAFSSAFRLQFGMPPSEVTKRKG